MQIVDNRLLVLRTRAPQKYAVIPKSKVIGPVAHDPSLHEVAIHWGLDEVRVLKNLGVRDVPSPIMREYDWPGQFTPMSHQREMAAFMTLHRRGFVFSEPGTGKTVSALWAADYLMRKGGARRCLVLCPLSIMESAWMQDIRRSILHRTAVVAHHAQASRRVDMVRKDYEFVIINYDGLNLIADEIVKDGRFDIVIADEANHYKNQRTARWASLAAVVKPQTMLWMMTGTPAAQSPLDAYGLAKMVNPQGVPKFFTGWRDLTMTKLSMFKWVPKPNARDTVFKALQPAVRFTKAQCLDLPPVITVTREVPLTAQQQKYYRQIKEQMIATAAGEQITAINAADAVNKLLQISAGAAYTANREVIEFDCSSRLNVLMEVIDETDRKVIVFAPFRHSIETVSIHLTKKGIDHGIIHGDIPVDVRSAEFKRFQSDENYKVLVIQPQAAAHGVTLTAADNIVFWGPVSSTETYLQCIARADRIGQNADKVTVTHLEGSEIEKRLYRVLSGRVADHNLLVKLYEEELKS